MGRVGARGADGSGPGAGSGTGPGATDAGFATGVVEPVDPAGADGDAAAGNGSAGDAVGAEATTRPAFETAPRRFARPTIALLAATAVLFLAVLIASLGGAAGLPVAGTAEALLNKLPFVHFDTGLTAVQQGVLDQIRLPRVVLATLVGALLAQAGAAYQGVFRNPLSDSGTIGASAGAGMAATLVIVYGGGPEHTFAGIGAVPLAAFVGGLAGVLASYVLGTLVGRGGTASLILAGVAVSSFVGSVQAFVMQSSTADVKQVYSWLFGSFTAADWGLVRLALPYAAVSVLIVTLHARHLDVLALGDDEAATLGLNPVRIRLIVLAAASLATATAVAVSGIIGFVGLVVPHVVRRVAGPGHRLLLPMSLLVGGAFLVLADLLARTALAPAELPIGVVTSFVGAPFFVLILRATRGRDR
ncbi:MAG: iron ABC transporter permease [Catenulispora sp.]|nr:iron ABC transporter permease [Catenulispora sp.]